MRRVLAACWGTDASVYVGRRVTLYCDENVRFGNETVGGTRISHLSHIDKPKSIPLLISRGKSATFKVQPLPDQAPTQQPQPDLKRMFAALDQVGVGSDKATALAYISDVIGRQISASKELTAAEVKAVLGAAEAEIQQQAATADQEAHQDSIDWPEPAGGEDR